MTVEEYNIAVKAFSNGLYRYATKQLRSDKDADDIVQHCFEKLWLKRDKVDAAKIKSYLFTSAHNAIIDFVRKHKRMSFLESMPEKSLKAVNYELKETLTIALSQLSDIQKSVVLLRDYEGYKYDEIAAITQLSIAQVKVYIFRARKKLQAIIKEMDADLKDVV